MKCQIRIIHAYKGRYPEEKNMEDAGYAIALSSESSTFNIDVVILRDSLEIITGSGSGVGANRMSGR
jgi:hypothetical protein